MDLQGTTLTYPPTFPNMILSLQNIRVSQKTWAYLFVASFCSIKWVGRVLQSSVINIVVTIGICHKCELPFLQLGVWAHTSWRLINHTHEFFVVVTSSWLVHYIWRKINMIIKLIQVASLIHVGLILFSWCLMEC